jgi:hypothetical protein
MRWPVKLELSVQRAAIIHNVKAVEVVVIVVVIGDARSVTGSRVP